MTAKSERRRIGRRVLLGAACLITVLCVALVFAALRNDRAITGHLGTANAQVDSVAFDRTIIRYETPDGIVHSPETGVLYPEGLAAGQLVRIEYDSTDPELARVAGRSAELTLLPLGMMILFTWLVAGLYVFLARPRSRGQGRPPLLIQGEGYSRGAARRAGLASASNVRESPSASSGQPRPLDRE